jgi:hypothetical protein
MPDRVEDRTPFSDAEIGQQMRIKARNMIDSGELKTEEDAINRFKLRAQWIADMTNVSEETRIYWLKFEQSLLRSARKYFAEIRENESTFKK